MDVRLYWSGDFPEYLGPLLEALEALPGTDDASDGEVLFCPDATLFPAPAEPADAYVAAVPDPASLYDDTQRDPLARSLRGWAERGALFVIPTATAAANLRVLLDLPAERVHVVPLPLPPDRVPDAVGEPGTDILALPPINYNSLLPAVKLARLAGVDPRVLLADPAAGPVVRPGGLANAHGLLSHTEVVQVDDWREAAKSAGAIVLFDPQAGDGGLLREVLATGVPVLAPRASTVEDHLSAIGAGLYPYAGPTNTPSLAAAIAAALRRDRGTQLEPAAREAVLNESWPAAAAALYGVLLQSLAPAPAPAESNGAWVTGEGLSICVINPHASGGGGERFMRELVRAMARHESRPHVKLVAKIQPNVAFDPGTRLLQQAGVQVHTVPGDDFAQVAAEEMRDADIVYCSWPHMTEPPLTDAPLVCTFHDFNWKHFDVYDPGDKVQLEAQSPLWVERTAALVHSSNFIRGEMHQYYGAPESQTHVIPLTGETPAQPATPEERAAVRRRFGLPERFLLSPAGCHLHKNYPVLDAALRLLRREGRPIKVVASGALTDIRYHGPDLIGLGYVNARELQALYEESDGMVQTSLYEAGSFPMWEAMAAHKPVAISRIPPVVEQVERLGATVELFDPLDPEDVAAALARLWDGSPATSPETLERNAEATAARSWNDVAGDYLELFARLHAGARNGA
jgi:glycosyltransferase involved in cell wall biosynthesis